MYFSDEMHKLLKLSGAKCIITVAANYTTVLQAISMLESLEKPFIIVTQGTEVTTTIPEGAVNFQELIAKDVDTSLLSTVQPASPNDVVALPFSSGTTGLPKGVQLTHRNLVANILQTTLRPHLNYQEPTTSYGLTETSPCVILMPKELKNSSSIGHLIPNTEAKVVDLVTDLTLPVGGVGELWIRGPQVMKGYLDNIEATNDVIDQDNWLRTGDLACYDENNLFYIKDRLKELIKVKGYQVAPAELEEILRSHPSVAEAAVIGVPDKRAGEVPRAFVVCTSEVSEDELKNYVAGKVSDFKQLVGGVTFLESIPKNPSGKILRKLLKEEYIK
uniref:4-coumarate--CoA ligase n=1 Tax=Timema poppense TaxID=170557 RepID=A0A7R9GT26_TIMPO|nr:unnamed protein product [Timema poppensis]